MNVTTDITNEQGSMCAEEDLLQEHRIVENCMLEEHTRACFNDLAEVILCLHITGREMLEK